MDLIQTLILALIQGITEFLPISSSAHLILPSQLLGWNDQGLAFDVAVHVGTLTAVMVYYRQDIRNLLYGSGISVMQKKLNGHSLQAIYVIIGTIPAVIAGLAFKDLIEQDLRAIEVIAATTIIFGVLLGIADKAGKRELDLFKLTWAAALIIGMAQCLALIPGTSRSGITITAALLLGFDRQSAARFSFLLSMPLIFAAGTLKTWDLIQLETGVDWTTLLIGTVVSGISAWFCIALFIRLLDRIGMMPFVIYRLLLGAVLIYIVTN